MVRNLINNNGNATANQFVITTKKGIFFQSYQSVVCKIGTDDKVTLSSDWDYSATTRKYLYQFLGKHTRYVGLKKKDVLKLINDKTFKYNKKSSLAV